MTLQEAREAFEARGETIRSWARRHGFKEALVYAVLCGRIRGTRGQSHAIALALGLKECAAERVTPLCTNGHEMPDIFPNLTTLRTGGVP